MYIALNVGFFWCWQPHVDFGLKLLGGDVMAIPGLYGFVQVCGVMLCLNLPLVVLKCFRF